MEQIRIQDHLPFFYEKFLPKNFFIKKMQTEKTADCSNCIMCKPKLEQHYDEKYFHSDTKCCTFYPKLPNYLVGAILADNSESMLLGKNKILNAVNDGLGVSPLGLLRPEKYTLIYQNVFDENPLLFGKVSSLVCPYLDNGNCTVWKYRNGICTTWFCYSDNGVDGIAFWDSLKKYLNTVENKLIKYTLLYQGFSTSEVDTLFNTNEALKRNIKLIKEEINEEPLNNIEYKELWGNYNKKEVEYYINCYNLVRKLNEKEFDQIMGIDGKTLLQDLENKYSEMLSKNVPLYLIRNSNIRFIKIDENNEKAHLDVDNCTFSIAYMLYESLIYFNGKASNIEVLNRVEEQGLKINNDLLLYLYKHRFLLPYTKN